MSQAKVFHAQLWGTRKLKYAALREHDIADTEWAELAPQSPFYPLVPRDREIQQEYLASASIVQVLPESAVGMVTARDGLTLHWTSEGIWEAVRDFVALSSEAARGKFDLGSDTRDWRVALAQEDVRSDGPARERIQRVLYRPFDTRYTYYTGRSRGFICMPRAEVMTQMIRGQNLGLVCARSNKSQAMDHFLVSRLMTEAKCGESTTQSCLLPLYLFGKGAATEAGGLFHAPSRGPSQKGGRVANLSPDSVSTMGGRLGLTFVPDGVGDLAATFGPEDVFHYIYAVFHAPTYRERYAEFLKIDFPRVPLTSDIGLFRALCGLGADLVALHLLEDDYPHASWNCRRGVPAPRDSANGAERRGAGTPRLQAGETGDSQLAHLITTYPVPGDNTVAKGHPKYLPPGDPEPGTRNPLPSGRVYISKDDPRAGTQGQYFEGVPPEVWEFHVGGYQVCAKWLKDRVGRQLSYDDLTHYQRVVVALKETIRLMAEIDAAIEAHGGWPIQ